MKLKLEFIGVKVEVIQLLEWEMSELQILIIIELS